MDFFGAVEAQFATQIVYIGCLGRLGAQQDLQLLHVLDAASPALSTAANSAANRLRQTIVAPAVH